jgi:ABC-type cobalamin/Fe3+-siderophores transport system ATPase subunit
LRIVLVVDIHRSLISAMPLTRRNVQMPTQSAQMSDNNKHTAILTIATLTGDLQIPLVCGKPLIILGHNGTGKSALTQTITRQLPGRHVYLPGARPSYFASEGISLNAATRHQLDTTMSVWNTNEEGRWRMQLGTGRNEKAIYDLKASETQFNYDITDRITKEGKNSSAISLLQSANRPVDRVNTLLMQSNMAVRIVMDAGELRCQSGDDVYSIAKMSDGERSTLVIAAETVAAASGTIFIIDEPELHIHKSIVVPLLAALIRERPDCCFVVCTHELDLATYTPEAQVLLVRGCRWAHGMAQKWDVDLLKAATDIPESLRVDVLGARRHILFIEGKPTSLDQPLFALLYPQVSVACRGSCTEVIRAVSGLRATEDIHHIKAFGLIDSDGMHPDAAAEFEGKWIFALPVFAIESLYYCREILDVLANQQATSLDRPADELLLRAKRDALKGLSAKQRTRFAAKVSERRIRDKILSNMPGVDSIIASETEDISISIVSPYRTQLVEVNDFIKNENLDEIIARYPVRESGMLGAIATALHFTGRDDFERAAITRVSRDKALQAVLRRRMGIISERLMG